MALHPYRTARQEHLGNYLDSLARRRLLKWRWDYDSINSRAEYWISCPPSVTAVKLDTRKAEELAVRLAASICEVWLPVRHPGGETQRAEVLREIADLLRQNTKA